MRPRSVLLLTFAAALAVFCVVQDRVTAAGARQYVAQQRAAWAGQRRPVTIDEVVGPAVERSVRQAALWSGLILVFGGVAAGTLARRGPRP
jgi:hypothetical protein